MNDVVLPIWEEHGYPEPSKSGYLDFQDDIKDKLLRDEVD